MPPKPRPRQEPRSWREGKWRGGGLETPQPFSCLSRRGAARACDLLAAYDGVRGVRRPQATPV